MFPRNITVNTRANTTDLTTRSTVKGELSITSSGDDSKIDRTIEEATSIFEQECGRVFAREQITEKMGTQNRQWNIVTTRAPIIEITEILEDDDTISANDYEITDAQAGLIFNDGRWVSTQINANDINVFPTRHQLPDIDVKYWAGYLLPGDDISGSTTISVDDSDNSFNDSGNNFPKTLLSGDIIKTSGFANASNNGTFTVASQSTTGKIKVEESLTTESAPSGGVDITISSLPKEIERAVIELTKGFYLSSQRDPGLQKESIGDFWSATYKDNESASMPSTTARAIKRWQRLV